ncbi:MAG: PilZ domain-containing protein [Desulfosalsimonas sp.]|uniref:PilZ domain-containing protein n=1 Tax=Desulfosalsimonas sp. TaxID=3073848 RepID=UPI0039711675
MLDSLKTRLRGLVRRILPGTRPKQLSPQVPDPDTSFDKRSFDRYQITFPVRISGKDFQNRPFKEVTRLQDVSGSGALFLSSFPDRYHVGQDIDVAIMLDAAEDVQACIRNQASVVRINCPEACGAKPDAGLQGIAVCFHHGFDFQRMAPEENGCPE